MKKRRILILSAVVLLLISFALPNVFAFAETDNQGTEENIYEETTKDDEFDPSVVLVTLTRTATFKFHTYTPSDFPKLRLAGVEQINSAAGENVQKQLLAENTGDWSTLQAEIDSDMLVNIDNHRALLSLRLKEASKSNVLESIKRLERRKDVLKARPSYIISLQSVQTEEPGSDTGYYDQWALDKIDLPRALEYIKSKNMKSQTITVGVMDTGIDARHPALVGSIHYSEPHNINTTLHRDFTVSPGPNKLNQLIEIPQDPRGHGTHVSGLIAGEGVGVWQNVKLVSLRVFDENGSGSWEQVADAVDYAQANLIPILNYSGGGYNKDDGFEKAIGDYAGIFVCAAGNAGINAVGSYPSGYNLDNIISVGASTDKDRMAEAYDWGVYAGGSNYGSSSVDIFAPGTNVYSAFPANGYEYMSGTSMASPIVAGTCAMLKSLFGHMMNAEIKAAILDNADIIPELENDPISGRLCGNGGRLNIFNAVYYTPHMNILPYFKVRHLSGAEIEITGVNVSPVSNLIIPSQIDGKIVTSIGTNAFFGRSDITAITIPESVTHVGRNAFRGTAWYDNHKDGLVYAGNMSNVNQVLYEYKGMMSNNTVISNIAHSAVVIADSSFSGHSSLKGVAIPDNVTHIGNSAFQLCQITSVTLPDSLTTIGSGAFSKNYYLTGIVIPDSVTSIGYCAFYNGDSLADVIFEINSSLTTIGDAAFQYCMGLESIEIPAAVTSLGNNLFYYDSSLINVVFMEGINLTAIGNSVFYSCIALISVTIPESVTNIGCWAFYNCSGLTQIVLPNNLKSIHNAAFYGCNNLNGIVMPNSVTRIGDGAFYNCRSVTEITIPANVASIGNQAFFNCIGLAEIVIPDTVTRIGWGAFSGCNGLESITIPFTGASLNNPDNAYFGYIFGGYNAAGQGSSIPKNLKTVIITGGSSIEPFAFYKCNMLINIIMPNSVTSIGEDAFNNCNMLTNIVVPNSVTSIGERAFYNCIGLTSIQFQLNSELQIIKTFAFYGCAALTDITIPNSVTHIEQNAFTRCTGIINVAFESGSRLMYIGSYAFSGLSRLQSIIIPSLVISIGSSAFESCSAITDVTFESKSNLINIEVTAFRSCSRLTSITIPDSVTSIGSSAFSNTGIWDAAPDNSVVCADKWAVGYKGVLSGSLSLRYDTVGIADGAFSDSANLTSVTIPASLANIGSYAFSGCTNLSVIRSYNAVLPPGAFGNINVVIIPVAYIGDYDYYVESAVWCKAGGTIEFYTGFETGSGILQLSASPDVCAEIYDFYNNYVGSVGGGGLIKLSGNNSFSYKIIMHNSGLNGETAKLILLSSTYAVDYAGYYEDEVEVYFCGNPRALVSTLLFYASETGTYQLFLDGIDYTYFYWPDIYITAAGYYGDTLEISGAGLFEIELSAGLYFVTYYGFGGCWSLNLMP